MGLMDKFKDFMGFPEEDYDYEEDEYEVGPNNEAYKSTPAPQQPDAGYAADVPKRNNKVVNIHATTQLQVVLVKPERFEDASSVADHLNEKRTVVLNLESTGKDVSRRLIDFLSGVAYANNGQIKRVANSTYIITPYNVDIMGDLLDELENNGVYF
ncbi:MAG: cell division protein SepF [Hydrogenoanaerobacterium sp.]